MNKFSIITPVYNRADCVKSCINSILKQTYTCWELLIINDGSTDKTLNIIESFAKNEKVKIISYDLNRGVNYARNRGIEQCTGDFIIFLDSDDVFADGALSFINSSISSNVGYSHYLFGVSDREGEFGPGAIKIINYTDWLSERVKGDFTHVITPDSFEGMMFFEDFRINEILNWMRIFKKNGQQLFINKVVVNRERNRIDSVVRETKLNSMDNISNSYKFLDRYIAMYANEYGEFYLKKILSKKIEKALVLGICLGEIKNNKVLLKYISNDPIRFIIYSILNNNCFKNLLRKLLMIKSKLNEKKRS